MKPSTFYGYNARFSEDQDEYLPLPAHQDPDGRVTTCWKASIRERLVFLLTGTMWLQCLTFNMPLQPLKLSVERPTDRIG
jgi:hypothetical protein